MKRKRIAVFVASIDREYQQDFAQSLATAAAIYDMDICIFNSQGHMNVATSTTSDIRESIIYDLPDLNEFDGFISMPATMGNDIAYQKVMDAMRPIGLQGKPHVSIDIPQAGAVSIMFDDAISIRELTEHMIQEHGARRIAFVSGPLNSRVAINRVEACRETLDKYGLKLEEGLLLDGQWTRVGGRKAAEQILAYDGELPDAVICANDDMALSVIEYFVEHGIRVPQDIAVTGFDALREAVMRGLTTICRPIDRSARKAADILHEWIDGKAPAERTVTLSTIPIYGETCGCSQNLEHMNEQLRALGTERWNMETILTRVSMFSGVMAGVGDELEAREKIREFASSWDIQEMYLCVDPSICRTTENEADTGKYPKEMLLLYGIRNGKEYPAEMFLTSDLVPSLHQMRKNTVCLVFCPLYYRDRNMGYVAMNLGNGTGSGLYSVLMLLNGAMMSLFLQTNIKRYARKIEDMVIHDPLTGMLNRRGFRELASTDMEQAAHEGKLFVVMSIDMDHMKRINDVYGHLMGDEAIARMGRILQSVANEGYTPVHISGDEFLVYGIASTREEADQLTGKIREEIDRTNREDPWICDLSASLGSFADVPEKEGDEVDRFLTNADRNMYADKHQKHAART